MPEIKVYVSDEVYIGWIQIDPEIRRKIRDKMKRYITESIKTKCE